MVDGKIRIGTELETKQVDAQIKELEHKLDIMTKTLETETQVDIKFRMSTDERLKLEKDIEITKNKILSLRQAQEKVNEGNEKVNQNMSKSFKKSANNLKRFALNLLSVGSLLAVVSKASSSYLSQNEELANKMQSVWVGLGSFLAPVIEIIADSLLKVLGYLNAFIKALTGVDFIARQNAKALEKQAQAQGKLNKETEQYDFDVIRKQQNSTTNNGGINYGAGSGFIDIPELDQNLVSKLQNLAYWLKENWNWLSKVGIALGVAFGAKKVAGLLSNIGSLIGKGGAMGSGLSSLAWILGTIATVWLGYVTIKGIGEAIKQTKNLNKELNENLEGHKEQTEKTAELAKQMVELAKSEENAGKHTKNATQFISRQIEITKRQHQQLENQLIPTLLDWNGANETTRKEMEYNVQELNALNEQFWELYKQGKLNDEMTLKLAESLIYQGQASEELGYDTKDLQLKLLEIDREFIPKIKIDGTNETVNKIQSVINKIKELGSLSGLTKSVVGVGADIINSYRGFAHGGIVTQPTRALIGEAGYPEAVVPMTSDYLSTLANAIGQYSGGNGTTNVYLDGRLIQRQINNKQNKVNFATNS